MEKQKIFKHNIVQIGVSILIVGASIFFALQGTSANGDSSALIDAVAENSPIFEDVPIDHWARPYIEALYLAGYVGGCNLEPLQYCPDNAMKRCESAVFVERGVNGSDHYPPFNDTQLFADVPPGEWYDKWVQALWNDGYTDGCGDNPLVYCPQEFHTIAEGSVFFLRMLQGPDYVPPDPSGIFVDAPIGSWYTRWVEAAYYADLLIPCEESPALRACPEEDLMRDMAAYMMYQAKGLGDINPSLTPTPPTPPPTVTPTPSGNVYYVSVSGSDNNSGNSASQPWRTIQKAVNGAKAGDTIEVMAGTYYESLSLRTSGSSSQPIRLKNYSNDVVVIDGGSNHALLNSGNTQYWTIQGLTLKSTNRYTIRLGWWGSSETANLVLRDNLIFGSVFTIGSYHLFENNEIDGTGYSGSYGDAGLSDASNSHHITYRNNYVHDFRNYNGRGIWTQGLTHDNVIEGNIIENITGPGLGQCIDLDGASNVEWRHVVRNNTIDGCSYVGIQLENIFDSLIENNTIHDSGSAGIIVINYTSSVGCGTGGEQGQYGDQNGDRSCMGYPTDNILRGNTITKDGGWGWGYGGIINWGAGTLTITDNIIKAAYGAGNAGINFQRAASDVEGAVILRNEIDLNDAPAICALEYSPDVFVVDDYNVFHRANRSSVYGRGSGCNDAYTLEQYQNEYDKAWNSTYLAD